MISLEIFLLVTKVLFQQKKVNVYPVWFPGEQKVLLR